MRRKRGLDAGLSLLLLEDFSSWRARLQTYRQPLSRAEEFPQLWLLLRRHIFRGGSAVGLPSCHHITSSFILFMTPVPGAIVFPLLRFFLSLVFFFSFL